MWRKKFLGLRKASLVLVILIWNMGLLYSKGWIGVKAGIGINPYSWDDYTLILLGVEREASFSPKNGVSWSFRLNNWQLELISEIRLRGAYSYLKINSTFDFSPRLRLCIYDKLDILTGMEAVLDVGFFLTRVVVVWGISQKDISRRPASAFFYGFTISTCFKDSIRRIHY
jgi:hypothetical protein